MKTNEQAFDAMLRESLTREEAEVFESLGQPSLFDIVTNLFRGSTRWLNILCYVLGLAFFVLGIVCLIGFLRTDDVATMLRWGAGLAGCAMITMLLKVWFWLELHRYVVSRELKRLQLQVAHLASHPTSPNDHKV